ncbi:MAG: flagellar motor protein MotB [Lachnospiraceae bacterium]|nr:flagellar motor protein MotB [Lachnospiraceae bacterium]
MAKKPEEPPKGAPAWQSTFADLMNLLLCFFVLLFSMSSIEVEKFEAVAASFSQAFSIFDGGQKSFGEGALVGDGISQLNELNIFINSMGQSDSKEKDKKKDEEHDNDQDNQEEALQEQLQASEELAEQIAEALMASGITDVVELNFTSQYVQLTLQGSILFDSGKVEIKEEAKPILEKVGKILERYAGGTIEIEGHTDNVPMHGAKYSNNDELSSGRALSVFNYLLETTSLDPARIMHTGRGEYQPVATNETPEGRAKNRRVEIRIYNPLSPMY